MKRLIPIVGLCSVGLYYFAVGASGIANDLQNGNMALSLKGISESELHKTILDHYTEPQTNELGDLKVDAIKTTITDLNDDGQHDVIATVESNGTCGTGGCIGSIFVSGARGQLEAISFAYAFKEIEVLMSITQGMHDLRINGDESNHMIWNGITYELKRI